MATDYFAAKKAMLAPVSTTSNATATTANVTPGKTAIPKAPVGGSLITNVTTKVNKAPLAPVSPINTGVSTSSTKISTAPTAPITNAALGGAAAPTGFGGATYTPGGASNSAITANQSKLSDPNFKESEINRTLGVIQNRAAQGMDTTEQNKYLSQNLGYTAPPAWVTAEEDAYFKNQLAGLQGQSDAAKLAMQSGVDTNNAYLQEQLRALAAQNAVNNDAAQQLQNRRGGLYSGGLDYQLGSIVAAYANQQGGLQRDIAARNQQLIDQYGTQANTIAQQINNLQQAQPDIIRSRIENYQNSQVNRDATIAGLTGMYNGQQTMAGQNQSFNQNLANKQANLNAAQVYMDASGQLVSPQENWGGYTNQINSGVDSNGQSLNQTLQGAQTAQAMDINNRQYALQEWGATGYATPVVSKILGVPVGTPTSDQSYRDASIGLDAEKFKYSQMQDVAKTGAKQAETINAATAGDLIKNALTVTTTDEFGDTVTTTVSDPIQREQLFVDLYNQYGLTGKDMQTALIKGGYGMKEIESLKKEYPEVFQ